MLVFEERSEVLKNLVSQLDSLQIFTTSSSLVEVFPSCSQLNILLAQAQATMGQNLTLGFRSNLPSKKQQSNHKSTVLASSSKSYQRGLAPLLAPC